MVTNLRKVANFRPIVLICANLILGILITVTLNFSVGLFAFLGCAFLFANLCSVIFFIYKKNKRVYVSIIISLTICLFVCALFAFRIYKNVAVESLGEFTIYGEVIKVNSVNETDAGYTVNVFIKVLNGKLKGEVVETYLYSNTLFFNGYKVEVVGNLESNRFYKNGYLDAVNLRYGVNYFLSNSKILNVSSKITNPFYYVKYLLYHRLNSSNALNFEFIYALLTGDVNFLSDVTLSKFRNVGVAHIFAVSGLHIGFLYAFITLIFKPFKINSKVKYVLTLFLLFLYVYFCGVTPSCLRAFIIIAVSNFARSFGFKNDKLSSVFFSMLIVLSLNCCDLFNIGFHLSYVACLSLMFLTPKFEKVLDKAFPNKVSKFLAPYISAYVGTLPIVCDVFSNSTAFSMLFNIVIVPFMSFVFILCFISSVIILLFSRLLFIMQVASVFVSAIIWFVNAFLFIVLLKIPIKFYVSCVFYYFMLIMFSGILNLKEKSVKIISILNLILFVTVFLVINVGLLY